MSGIGHTTKPVSATGDPLIDGLITDIAWGDSLILYSFPGSGAEYDYQPEKNTFAPLGAEQRAAVRFMLDSAHGGAFAVSGFTALDIAGTTAPKAHIRVALSDDPPTVRSYLPGPGDANGDVWFGTAIDYTTPVAGNMAWFIHMRELGHALGLKIASDPRYYGKLPAAWDGMEYTVMSYRSFPGGSMAGYTNETWGYAQTWMMLDIAALQALYGADYTINSGDTVYKWDPNSGRTWIDGQVAIDPGANRIFATIWDGGGTDTYDLGAYATDLVIDLAPGGHSRFSAAQLASLGNGHHARGNIYNALLYNNDPRSLIENAIGGSGDDVIRGNIADNELWGRAGDDRLIGREGDDTLHGGAGNDTLRGGDGNDTLRGNDGADLLSGGTGSDELHGGAGGDELHGNAGNDALFGDRGDDVLYGDAGADTLSGGAGHDALHGGAGNDVLAGGAGDDLLFGGRGDDILFGGDDDDELHGQKGNDQLQGHAGADTLHGDRGNDALYGGLGADRLFGGAGRDILDGGGGNDRLRGGAGADTFVYGRNSDTDRILDFQDDLDTIDLTDWGFTSVNDALAYAVQVGSNVKFDFSTAAGGSTGDILWVNNITIADLTNDIIV